MSEKTISLLKDSTRRMGRKAGMTEMAINDVIRARFPEGLPTPDPNYEPIVVHFVSCADAIEALDGMSVAAYGREFEGQVDYGILHRWPKQEIPEHENMVLITDTLTDAPVVGTDIRNFLRIDVP
jgi:hypothetical protein